MSKFKARIPEVVMGEPVSLRPCGVVMATEVTVPAPVPVHVPLMAKQPVSILIPLDREEVPVSLMYEAVPMPRSVEAVNLGNVEVAEVEVAIKYEALT